MAQTGESQPLVSSSNARNSPSGNNSTDPSVQAAQRRRRRRTKYLWIWILFILFFLSIIGVGIWVVVKAAQRRGKRTELAINLAGETTASPGCETTVMLMRHCEKFGPLVSRKHNQHCSYVGYERAHYMASRLFGKRWPNPSYLYALSPDRNGHENFRQTETLTPIATKLGLDIHNDYKEGQYEDVANEIFGIMQTGELCGKLVVVSWTHRSLPALAKSLGCWFNLDTGGCPSRYPESSFDEVWMLKYVFNPQAAIDKYHRSKDKWILYPSIHQMNFDALEYSYRMGDYPDGGVDSGGSWSPRKVHRREL